MFQRTLVANPLNLFLSVLHAVNAIYISKIQSVWLCRIVCHSNHYKYILQTSISITLKLVDKSVSSFVDKKILLINLVSSMKKQFRKYNTEYLFCEHIKFLIQRYCTMRTHFRSNIVVYNYHVYMACDWTSNKRC
jgi:hypothetical protein